MSDEIDQFILADTASAAAEEPPKRRGIFGPRRRSKLPERPLTHCENCGAPLTGEYCAKCGQHAIDYRRSILRVLLDAADSFLNWDTKFLKTLGLLLIRPWELTNDFNAGRRARYVHPLRLYLIASVIFFLVARAINLESREPVALTTQDRAELVANLAKLTGPDSPLTPEQREQIEAARTKLSQGNGALSEEERTELKAAFRAFLKSSFKKNVKAEERAQMAEALTRLPKAAGSPSATPDPSLTVPDPSTATESSDQPPAPPVSATPKPKKNGGMHFTTGGEDGKNKTPFGIWIEKQVKDKIGEDGSKARVFLDTLRSNIPAMMLVCIPLFAFVLKILYFRKRRFYVEHLVYALHIHTFFYVAMIITSLAVMGANRTVPALGGWITGLMTCAIIVQVFLSIRRVYGQGWFMTMAKFLFGGLVYSVILFLAVAATALVTLMLPG